MRDLFLEHTKAHTMHLALGQSHQSFIVLEEGRKIEIGSVSYHSGGGAVNSAVSFAKAGHLVTTLCTLGRDHEGEFIKNDLLSKHVDIEYIIYDSHKPTGTSIIIPCRSGDRAVFVYRGANDMLTPQKIPLAQILAYDHLYITSLSNNAACVLPYVAKEAHKHSLSVSVNPGTSQLTTNVQSLIDALPYIDIFILNTHEATLLMQALVTRKTTSSQSEQALDSHGTHFQSTAPPSLLQGTISLHPSCFSLPHFFAEIKSHGPRIIVVTNGAEGVYATDGTTIYFHPSITTPVVSTLGAGDAFGSRFVSALLHGTSIANALRAGAVNAASVLSAADAQEGLLTYEETLAQVEGLDPALLQQFPWIS